MRSKLAPAIVLGGLQLGDLLLTRFALDHGAVETNFLVSSVGLWEAKLVCLVVIALFAWHTRKPSRICSALRARWFGFALAGANMDGSDPEVPLRSISRYYRFLPAPQRRIFLAEVNQRAS